MFIDKRAVDNHIDRVARDDAGQAQFRARLGVRIEHPSATAVIHARTQRRTHAFNRMIHFRVRHAESFQLALVGGAQRCNTRLIPGGNTLFGDALQKAVNHGADMFRRLGSPRELDLIVGAPVRRLLRRQRPFNPCGCGRRHPVQRQTVYAWGRRRGIQRGCLGILWRLHADKITLDGRP